MSSLHHLLRKTRQQKEVTQSELSVQIDLSPQLISAFETGRIRPSKVQLEKISQALQVPLYTFTGEKVAVALAKITQLERDLSDLKSLLSEVVEDVGESGK